MTEANVILASEAARQKGCSPQAIYRALDDGRLTEAKYEGKHRMVLKDEKWKNYEPSGSGGRPPKGSIKKLRIGDVTVTTNAFFDTGENETAIDLEGSVTLEGGDVGEFSEAFSSLVGYYNRQQEGEGVSLELPAGDSNPTVSISGELTIETEAEDEFLDRFEELIDRYHD